MKADFKPDPVPSFAMEPGLARCQARGSQSPGQSHPTQTEKHRVGWEDLHDGQELCGLSYVLPLPVAHRRWHFYPQPRREPDSKSGLLVQAATNLVHRCIQLTPGRKLKFKYNVTPGNKKKTSKSRDPVFFAKKSWTLSESSGIQSVYSYATPPRTKHWQIR